MTNLNSPTAMRQAFMLADVCARNARQGRLSDMHSESPEYYADDAAQRLDDNQNVREYAERAHRALWGL